jgi:hypothetical protein
MHLRRVKTLHHVQAELHAWIVRHVPLCDSMLGYDLFLAIGEQLGHVPLDLSLLVEQLSYSNDDIQSKLVEFETAGLLQRNPEDRLVVSARARELLLSYFDRLDRAFIFRDGMRGSQLLTSITDDAQRLMVEALYDRFFDIGWLYLHNFGSTCFMMATLVAHLARACGHQARIVCAHLEISFPQGKYGLGAKGFAGPSEIEGHAVCIIDESTLVDFGLGNARRTYRRDFYWGLACTYAPDHGALGCIQTRGETLRWVADDVTPAVQAELAACERAAGPMLGQFQTFFA